MWECAGALSADLLAKLVTSPPRPPTSQPSAIRVVASAGAGTAISSGASAGAGASTGPGVGTGVGAASWIDDDHAPAPLASVRPSTAALRESAASTRPMTASTRPTTSSGRVLDVDTTLKVCCSSGAVVALLCLVTLRCTSLRVCRDRYAAMRPTTLLQRYHCGGYAPISLTRCGVALLCAALCVQRQPAAHPA
jgi:hypothetical protein